MKVKITDVDSDWSSPSLAESGYKVGEVRDVTPDYFRNELCYYWDEERQMSIFPEECEVVSYD